MFEIDKSIPIPRDGRGMTVKYPFREMEVGDSFLISAELIPKTWVKNFCAATAHHRPKKFTMRKIDENSYRVWRIE